MTRCVRSRDHGVCLPVYYVRKLVFSFLLFIYDLWHEIEGVRRAIYNHFFSLHTICSAFSLSIARERPPDQHTSRSLVMQRPPQLSMSLYCVRFPIFTPHSLPILVALCSHLSASRHCHLGDMWFSPAPPHQRAHPATDFFLEGKRGLIARL